MRDETAEAYRVAREAPREVVRFRIRDGWSYVLRLLFIRPGERVIRSGSCPSSPSWSRARYQSVPWRARVA